ncbi:hypothetical protein SeMB42_g06167 [Synchytrium endobioticum]|uniref:Ubiquitin-like domain-containing protein n=1 Tax=Synchytrium endobioticum TaxID=286115 RepID=A0A507D1K1_9FUNG|nr:hypothetical protein SeMB42_g06167 [Synchytrium endobioticum]TPX45294.1 hypothetical protein SeLEV6574_g03960 [Synchytrium endobioticum]
MSAVLSPQPTEEVISSEAAPLNTPTSSTQPEQHQPASNANSNQVGLRLLLVSGKKHDVLADPTETVDAVRRRVYENWPKDWSEETPESSSQLRLLLRGKFLELNSTMEGNKIPTGQTTTVHLIIKAGSSTDNTAEKSKRLEETTRCRCSLM